MKKKQPGRVIPPEVLHALDTDGAIRLFDGRWSGGFVDEAVLQTLIRRGFLREQKRDGMSFAIRLPAP